MRETLFGIASNTKVFTATALGLLVEEGKIEWDDACPDAVAEGLRRVAIDLVSRVEGHGKVTV